MAQLWIGCLYIFVSYDLKKILILVEMGKFNWYEAILPLAHIDWEYVKITHSYKILVDTYNLYQ